MNIHTTVDLSSRIGFKLHSQTPETPPMPSTNTAQVAPKRTYPHQTVSRNPSRSRSRTTRFHCSSSKRELELILEAGLVCPRRSSEEELLGPVVVRGCKVGFSVDGEELSAGEVGVEERWSRDCVLLRLRRDFISRVGIWVCQDIVIAVDDGVVKLTGDHLTRKTYQARELSAAKISSTPFTNVMELHLLCAGLQHI